MELSEHWSMEGILKKLTSIHLVLNNGGLNNYVVYNDAFSRFFAIGSPTEHGLFNRSLLLMMWDTSQDSIFVDFATHTIASNYQYFVVLSPSYHSNFVTSPRQLIAFSSN